jgi:cell filamentation protein
MADRYAATGAESEFEPGSRKRVLSNLLAIRTVGLMQEAESLALRIAQDWAIEHFSPTHRLTAKDICELHRQWLGAIYRWAGTYRSVNIGKGGFQFAAAQQVPRLMAELERGPMARYTPCVPARARDVAKALAVVHAELVLIHPFRDGNGRLARLVALLMGYQAGLPALDFRPLDGRHKPEYFAAIRNALDRDYEPITSLFERVVQRASPGEA